jgi:hypothetical protein
VPLVKFEKLLHVSSRLVPLARAPNRVPWFFLVGLLLGASMLACAIAIKQMIWRRTLIAVFLAIAIAWAALSALGGCFVTYTWLLTDHAAVRPNENVLQLGPWMLPMIALIPLVFRRRWPRSKRAAVYIALFAAGASVLGLLLKVLPMMYQSNWNIIALALPMNAGLAGGMWKLFPIETKTKKGASI